MSAFGDETDGQIGGDLLYLDAEQLYPGAGSAVSGAALVWDGRAISVRTGCLPMERRRGVTIAHQDDRYRSDYAEKLFKGMEEISDLLLFASDYLTDPHDGEKREK